MMMSSLDRTSPQQLEQPCLKSEDKVVVKYLWICQKLSNKSTQSCQKGGKKNKISLHLAGRLWAVGW